MLDASAALGSPVRKKCGQECQVFSRCCGYYRPVVLPGKNPDGTQRSSWNKGKTSEWKDRKTYLPPLMHEGAAERVG